MDNFVLLTCPILPDEDEILNSITEVGNKEFECFYDVDSDVYAVYCSNKPKDYPIQGIKWHEAKPERMN